VIRGGDDAGRDCDHLAGNCQDSAATTDSAAARDVGPAEGMTNLRVFMAGDGQFV
jgi:hypothetical protein